MVPVDHNNRRHAWTTADGRHAVCGRCNARLRVSIDITDAGIRAAVERHGPAKCPGSPWWRVGLSYWERSHDKPEPPPPWTELPAASTSEASDRAAAPGAARKAARSATTARPSSPSGRTQKVGRPSKAARSAASSSTRAPAKRGRK